MTHIAGVDLSTRQFDCAVIPYDTDQPNTAAFHTIPIAKAATPWERARNTARSARWLANRVTAETGDIELWVIEQPIGNRNPWTQHVLSAVYGIILASCDTRAISLTASKWRSIVNLRPVKGGAKVAARLAAEDWLGTPIPSDDLAEALLLAVAGRHENDRQLAA